MMKQLLNIAGIVLTVWGFVIMMINQNSTITGAFIGLNNQNPISNVVFGLFMILFGLTIFFRKPIQTLLRSKLAPVIKTPQIPLTSAIKRNLPIRKLAEHAAIDQGIKRELDHLTLQLSRGNLQAGLGTPGHLDGTDIFYLRGRNGGRLYYHKQGSGYEILAKSGKGDNQDQVINKLRALYKR